MDKRVCTCVPCTTPAFGHPTIDHCAACCAGSLIEQYDHDCPIESHRTLAVQQFGPKQEAPQ